MGVEPEQVRPAELPVAEASRRVPGLDLGQPAHRDPVQPEPVAKKRAALEPRRRLEDPKVEPRRRDRLEVSRLSEERERLVELAPDELGALELYAANS